MTHSDWATTVNTFQFEVGVTPLSTWWTPFITVIVYLGVLAALKLWLQNRKPFDLRPLCFAYNSVVSIASCVLFLDMFVEIAHEMAQSSFWSVFCDPEGLFYSGRNYFLFYLNFLFKFVELFDTVLLVLRKKPTTPLHVFHHAATLVLCWTQLRAHSCVQWVPIGLNLFVHTVMYYFYALAALRVRVWWKRHLTVLQIIQFVLDVIACFTAFGSKIVYDYINPAYASSCTGHYGEASFGCGILFLYLLLFLSFYKRTYTPQTSHPKQH